MCIRDSLQESDDPFLLHLEVAGPDLGPELNLFDDGASLVLASFPGLDGLLVLVLPVVHETNHRRPGVRSDLHEVEFELRCQPPRFLNRFDTDLPAIRIHEANLFDPDAFVDPGLLDRSTSCSYVSTKQAPGAITKAAQRECCLNVRPGSPQIGGGVGSRRLRLRQLLSLIHISEPTRPY